MAEYIEREAVIKRLEEAREWCENRLSEGKFKSGCIAALGDELFNIQTRKLIPTADVVEVVRCKDCKHYEIHKPSVTLNCEREGKLIPMMPNDFCSYGRKKEGAENG